MHQHDRLPLPLVHVVHPPVPALEVVRRERVLGAVQPWGLGHVSLSGRVWYWAEGTRKRAMSASPTSSSG